VSRRVGDVERRLRRRGISSARRADDLSKLTRTRGMTRPSTIQKINSCTSSRRLAISSWFGRCSELRGWDAEDGRSQAQSARQKSWRKVCTVIDSKRRRRRKEEMSGSKEVSSEQSRGSDLQTNSRE
jgi:hypothetical protein